jgi:GNAT superfamily N-acetyltransferase
MAWPIGRCEKGSAQDHMDEEYKIVYVDKPEWGIIGQAINDYNEQQAGDEGGVIGAIYWDWFSLDLMWIKEELRGRGYGHRLLTLAEDKARQRGAKSAFLDTFSFQAPDFYKQHGYQVFGELPDFPHGHQRYYLTKQL